MIPKYFNFLREDVPLEEGFFHVPLKRSSRLIGFKPYGKYSLWNYIFSTFNCISSFLTGFCFFLTFATCLNTDLVRALNALGPSISMMVTSFKFWYLWWNKKKYAGLLDTLKDLFFDGKYIKFLFA